MYSEISDRRFLMQTTEVRYFTVQTEQLSEVNKSIKLLIIWTFLTKFLAVTDRARLYETG